MEIFCWILGIFLGVGLYFIIQKVLYKEEYDKAQQELNRVIAETKNLEDRAHSAYIQSVEYSTQSSMLEKSIQEKTVELNQISDGIKNAENTIREQMEQERERWYEEYCQSQENELQQAAKDFIEQFKDENSIKLRAAQDLQEQIDTLRITVASAIELAKHKMEEENKIEFYRLQLPDTSITDIWALRSVENLLTNAETINKVIWKAYYEKPYTDLIGRLGLSNSAVCGIYKITNIENEMTYIGQAVNIAERWKQHIKRGIGAEKPISNKLYPAMKQFGPENFTFEVIEKCSREKLNEREDYWQDFYKAKEFGYSMK